MCKETEQEKLDREAKARLYGDKCNKRVIRQNGYVTIFGPVPPVLGCYGQSVQSVGKTFSDTVNRFFDLRDRIHAQLLAKTPQEKEAEREKSAAECKKRHPPVGPDGWWTCGVCGRKSMAIFGEYRYMPRFWYVMEDVLHCKDCTWKQTVTYKETGKPPGDGWYPPTSEPVIEWE